MVERLPVSRHHHHIDAGIDCLSTVVVGASENLTDTIPIADNHPLKAHIASEEVSQYGFATVDLVAVPAVER